MTPTTSFGLPRARRLIGLLALLLAAVYVADAWQTLSVGRWHKPGAAIFPIAVGLLLAISAISVLLERHGGADDPMPATFALPAGADLRRLLKVLAAFALYFLAMPLLGNMIASALFLLESMWLLSDDPKRSVVRLAIYAVVIALSFELFFVRLLKVQMPGGLFKQWLF
ncbi:MULTISPECIES: tripartite tricarboxylate transporter TctB family protein [Bradyrhizobium]|uniref:Tripartite tricarboxylate transporter TctB family protein n=2 Tax=Bradyrhizobium TaxID=374 RepID=A0ABY0PC34_9BRAD|nr:MULTISPECIES: tripartite tricarboxylate transporter TctB family protein [Bradyrhizobium]SDI06237.1 Tripartite tricarboxylate transporter TctB family protein [Bradyrhizobium ottawaense]SED84962.1 Tripartite tricarboxylate transporter TctB family protein [Bradyrhizobium lablabi]SHL81023.1 Tripartite tricarboxylate transporter TctB family protein [Bradyrhizobium lablabi]